MSTARRFGKFATLAAAMTVTTFATTFSWGASFTNGNFDEKSSQHVGNFGARLDLLGTSGQRNWDVYTSIPGWTTVSGPGIEIQTNSTLNSIDAHSGDFYVELDSHPSPGDSTMAQTFELTNGLYELSFYYSPRTHHVNSNGISYGIFDGGSNLLFGNVTGPGGTTGSQVGQWSLITALFQVANTAVNPTDVTLFFGAHSDNNTLGGLIDTVSINRVNGGSVGAVPVPAAAVLFGTFVLGFGCFNLRRNVSRIK